MANRPRIDPASALKIHGLLNQCTAAGRDPIRAMDELGMLMFPELDAHLRAELLGAAAHLLDLESIDSIRRALSSRGGEPRRMPMTPYETKQMIVTWLLELAGQQFAATTKPTEENPQQ